MKKLIIHANCQGEMLQHILTQHAPFASQFSTQLYTNYIREPIPSQVLTEGDVFLYQYLGPDWGPLASEQLLAQVKKQCATLCIPNMYLASYWPLNYQPGHYVLRDRLLENLWLRQLKPQEYIYLATRPALLKQYNVQALVSQSLEYEYRKAQQTPISYLDKMLKHSTEYMNFYTPNHPGPELLLHVANQVLTWLDLPIIAPQAMPCLDPYYTILKMPVHPALAEIFSLTWLTEETPFLVYGQTMTYAQFAWLYAQYRNSNDQRFIDFMANLTGLQGSQK